MVLHLQVPGNAGTVRKARFDVTRDGHKYVNQAPVTIRGNQMRDSHNIGHAFFWPCRCDEG